MVTGQPLGMIRIQTAPEWMLPEIVAVTRDRLPREHALDSVGGGDGTDDLFVTGITLQGVFGEMDGAARRYSRGA
jgi:hypothetical protein